MLTCTYIYLVVMIGLHDGGLKGNKCKRQRTLIKTKYIGFGLKYVKMERWKAFQKSNFYKFEMLNGVIYYIYIILSRYNVYN